MSENDPYGSEGGALNDRPYPYCVPSMFSSSEVKVFYPTRWR